MKTDWPSRFAENVRDNQGYPIGKTIQYLTDPEIISLAGGLPSPDVFQRSELRIATERAFDTGIDRIMQYSPIPGEASLVQAVLRFLERDDIHMRINFSFVSKEDLAEAVKRLAECTKKRLSPQV